MTISSCTFSLMLLRSFPFSLLNDPGRLGLPAVRRPSVKRTSGGALTTESRHLRTAKVEATVANLRLVPEPMRLSPRGAEQVQNRVAVGDEELGDQPPVAPPPNGLRAHEAGDGLRDLLVERRLPLGVAHPCRVAAESTDAKATEAFFARFAAAPAAELDRVAVGDACAGERVRDRGPVELRVAP